MVEQSTSAQLCLCLQRADHAGQFHVTIHTCKNVVSHSVSAYKHSSEVELLQTSLRCDFLLLVPIAFASACAGVNAVANVVEQGKCCCCSKQ